MEFTLLNRSRLLVVFLCISCWAHAQLTPWQLVSGNLDFIIEDGYFSSPDSGIVVGNFYDYRQDNVAYIARTLDRGRQYELLFSDTTNSNFLRSIASIGDDLICVGRFGTAYRSNRDGVQWHRLDLGGQEDLNFIRQVREDKILIAGERGLMLESNDGGQTWKRRFVGSREELTGFVFADAENGLCFGYAGAVYKTADGGKNWRNISVDKAIRINTAVIIDAETFLVAGEENTIYKTNDSGRSWRRMYFEAPKLTAHKAIRFFDDSYGVLVDWEGGFLQDIKIYETFDQGEHWQLDTVVTLASGQSPFANRLLYFEAEQNLFVLGGRQSERGGAGQIYQSVLQKLPTSLPTLASSVSISLYPNPSSEVVTITGLPNKATQLEVFDLQGQSQLSRKTQAAQQQVTLQLSGLAEGAYLLKITDLSGQQFYSHRFLIIR